MNHYHLLKPRLDASGTSPSVTAQQNRIAKEKEQKAKKEGQGSNNLFEKEDGGPGSGPQPGGRRGAQIRRKSKRLKRGEVQPDRRGAGKGKLGRTRKQGEGLTGEFKHGPTKAAFEAKKKKKG